MTVKELIELLSTLDENAKVKVLDEVYVDYEHIVVPTDVLDVYVDIKGDYVLWGDAE